jgi:hypothetical protein
LWILDLDADEAWSELLQYVKDKTGSSDSLHTYMIRSGSGVGRHLIYNRVGDWTGSIPQDKIFLGIEKIELKANGIEAVPPSLHESGMTYEILHDVDPLDAPEWLIDAVERYRTPQHSSTSSGESTPSRNGRHPLDPPEVPLREGEGRNAELTSYAGYLEGKDHYPEQIRKMILERNYNPAWIADPLPEEEIDALMGSVLQWRQKRLGTLSSENDHGSPGAAAVAVMQHVGARSVEDLLKREFPPIKWAIPDLVPEGVTLLSAREKTGKSLLVLGWMLAVATGGVALGCKQVEQGDVLYLDLEDSERRLQERIRGVLQGRNPDLSGFEYATQWEKANEGGVERLEGWLIDHPSARLVVIDVFKRWKAKDKGGRQLYDVDYESVEELLALSKKHCVSIVLVHHNNKQVKPDDPFDSISGSTGLLGAVDGMIAMQRERGSNIATFWISGKDIKETAKHAMSWDSGTLSWTLEGDAERFFETQERQEIEALLESDGEMCTPKDVAETLNKNPTTVRWLLSEIIKRDTSRIVKAKYGHYCHVSSPHNPNGGLPLVDLTSTTNIVDDDLWGDENTPTNTTNTTNSPIDKPNTKGGATNDTPPDANDGPTNTNAGEGKRGNGNPRVGALVPLVGGTDPNDIANFDDDDWPNDPEEV